MMVDVSIILVNYNTCELVIQCIQSIYDHTKNVSFEIIIVDNASSDESVLKIQEKFPLVKFIVNDINIGFGKANNLGSEIAQGKYLFFLNSDTILLNNVIQIFFDFYEEKAVQLNIGCLGAILLSPQKEITHSFRKMPTFYSLIVGTFNAYFKINHLKKELKVSKNIKTFHEVGYITGADLFIDKELFQSVGGFHPSFFMYYEEVYLQYCLQNMNLKRYVLRAPHIIHLEGASYKEKRSNLKRIQGNLSMYKYLKLRYAGKKNTLFIYRLIYFVLHLPVIIDLRYTFRENTDYLRSLLK